MPTDGYVPLLCIPLGELFFGGRAAACQIAVNSSSGIKGDQCASRSAGEVCMCLAVCHWRGFFVLNICSYRDPNIIIPFKIYFSSFNQLLPYPYYVVKIPFYCGFFCFFFISFDSFVLFI